MWYVCSLTEWGITFKSVVPAALAFFWYIVKQISDVETKRALSVKTTISPLSKTWLTPNEVSFNRKEKRKTTMNRPAFYQMIMWELGMVNPAGACNSTWKKENRKVKYCSLSRKGRCVPARQGVIQACSCWGTASSVSLGSDSIHCALLLGVGNS